jgi:uncharacterized protein with NRDE domain
MCVVALAWNLHPRWPILLAGNRDEFHARPSQPFHRWADPADVLGGKDELSGGMWLGVSEAGRIAVITNVRNEDAPRLDAPSRGTLVRDYLVGQGDFARPKQADLEAFAPFNLLLLEGDRLCFVSNATSPNVQEVMRGLHSLSNMPVGAVWPRKAAMDTQFGAWLKRPDEPLDTLFEVLADETPNGAGEDARPIFIRDATYGTRCSTIIAVNTAGQGVAIERRFAPSGDTVGEERITFLWGGAIWGASGPF